MQRHILMALGILFVAGGMAHAISPAQEVALGEEARAVFLSKHRLSADALLAVRVNEIGHRVARISDRPGVLYQFLVLEGDEPQGYALPGGTVCVTEGLIRLLSTEDELAFALGHELAHIASRHHIFNFYRALETSREESAEQIMNDVVQAAFRQDQENEADRHGALYAVRAGYKFSLAKRALKRLARASRGRQSDAVHRGYDERKASLQGFKAELDLSLEAFRSGTESLQAGHVDLAIDSLRYFVAEFPYNAAGRINLGAAYLARVQKTAAHDVEETLPILPESGIVIRGMYDLVDLGQARRNFEQALQAAPDEALALAGLGLVHLRLGELEKARDYLTRAVELVPSDPQLQLCLGNVYYMAGDYEAAEANYRKAFREGWWPPIKNIAL